MANVLIPSLVRLHFPDRIGLVTALYTTTLAVGLTAAFLLTVPVADAFGGWRYGIGVWAVLAAVAAVPWFGLVRARRGTGRTRARRRLTATSRAPGWAGRWRSFFGLQSLKAYAVFGWFATLWRDAGFGAGTASALVGIVAGDVDPAVLRAAAGGGPAGRPALGAGAGHGLLPGRLRRPDRRTALAGGAVGGGPRHRAGDLPDRADLHRAAHPHRRRHRGAVRAGPSRPATCWPRSGRSGSACCTRRPAAGRSRWWCCSR